MKNKLDDIFTKWLSDNNWKSASNGWYKSESDHTIFNTTEELYNLFKNRNK